MRAKQTQATGDGEALPRLFISYSHLDEEFVDTLVAVLTANGFGVFKDEQSILPADNGAKLSKRGLSLQKWLFL